MKKTLSLAATFALVLAVGALAGCANAGGTAASGSAAASSGASAGSASAPAAGEDPTRDNPIVVDRENGEIRYLGYVNGVYLTEGTRHGAVYEGGSNGDKSIVTGYGDEKEFYQACIDLGWEPGDNLTAENMKGGDMAASVEGEKLDVLIRWDGQQDIPFGDCVRALNGEEYTPDWRFGGNLEAAKANNTGCVLCLDSCATGIASDAYWPTGTTDGDQVTYFVGRGDVLPADGTDVVFTFRKAA